MKWLAIILAVVAAGFAAMLAMNREKPVERTVPASAVASVEGITLAEPTAVTAPQASPIETVPVGKSDEALSALKVFPDFSREKGDLPQPEDADCLIFGPIPEKSLKNLRSAIEGIGWTDRMQIGAADLAERVVYAGPYSTQTKAGKALEKLAGEGLRNGKLFELPAGGWGIEIARTPHKRQAENWAREAANAWALKNVVVSERNSRKGYVELVFPNLSQNENKLLMKTLKGREGGKFTACRP